MKKNFYATGIGSLPFLDAKKAIEFIGSCFCNDIPFWPQLPRRSFLESMHIQYSEGFPGRVIDYEQKSMIIDTEKETFIQEFEQCFNALHGEALEYFAISAEYAAAFHEFVKQIAAQRYPFIKGQIIGPISYGMTLLDQTKRPIIFNAELSEVIALFLARKAVWQVQKMKSARENKVIIFIDEPYLVALGSNEFATLKRELIIEQLNTIIKAIHGQGAIAGIHCCGNTDWSLCFETEVDVVSFDAFEFMESIFIYKNSLEAFIKRGGILAWGIVPNKEDYDLCGYEDRAMKKLTNIMSFIENGAFITSSCGCGSVGEEFAIAANQLTAKIAKKLRVL